ncbi:MAG: hypothetical protein Ta2B_18150 [Termitinemataceae bacterium]|nr:MAG: hypothetical protein Ta2B_18150 [Termitinemataceae bacterium]
MMQIKRELKIAVCFLGIFILILYLLMILVTCPLVKEAKDVFCGKIPSSQIENRAIAQYDNVDSLRRNGYDIKKIKLMFMRIFTFHNFVSRGFIQVFYSIEVYGNDDTLLYASWYIPALWKIEKQNKGWEIIEINERP